MGMNSVTNIGRNGIQDWIIQRVTAYVLALYTLFLLGFFVTTDVDYQAWSALFARVGWLVDSFYRLHQIRDAAFSASGSLCARNVCICRVGHSDSLGALIDG